jgi:hypothetical protein
MAKFLINEKLQLMITLVKEVDVQIQSLEDLFRKDYIIDLEKLIKKKKKLRSCIIKS